MKLQVDWPWQDVTCIAIHYKKYELIIFCNAGRWRKCSFSITLKQRDNTLDLCWAFRFLIGCFNSLFAHVMFMLPQFSHVRITHTLSRGSSWSEGGIPRAVGRIEEYLISIRPLFPPGASEGCRIGKVSRGAVPLKHTGKLDAIMNQRKCHKQGQRCWNRTGSFCLNVTWGDSVFFCWKFCWKSAGMLPVTIQCKISSDCTATNEWHSKRAKHEKHYLAMSIFIYLYRDTNQKCID